MAPDPIVLAYLAGEKVEVIAHGSGVAIGTLYHRLALARVPLRRYRRVSRAWQIAREILGSRLPHSATPGVLTAESRISHNP